MSCSKEKWYVGIDLTRCLLAVSQEVLLQTIRDAAVEAVACAEGREARVAEVIRVGSGVCDIYGCS